VNARHALPAALVASLLASPALGAPPSDDAPPLAVVRPAEAPGEREPPPKRYAQDYVGFEVGARGTQVGSAGFGPYAKSDLLASVSLGATWEPLRQRPVYIGFTGEYDYGSRGASARGVPSSLDVHRASVGLRVRWEASRWVSLYAKAAPGLLHLRGSLDDAALDRPLVSRTWTWTVDALGGVAFPLLTIGDREWPATRMWLLAEGGYAFAGSAAMTYAPDADPTDARQFGSVHLPDLRVAGATSRVAVAMTF
jgi:hypothetical protein